MKAGTSPGPSNDLLELISANEEKETQVMAELCQRFLDEIGMPAEWDLRIEVPIFKGKNDIRNCSCHRTVKLLEHGMKEVEIALGKGFVEW